MKKEFGTSWFPRVEWKKELGTSWFPGVGWEGFGKLKLKHDQGFGCFMVPKSGVGRAWEGSK